jgi:hypothetical protein
MSQSQWILKALEQRPLTAIEALEGCGCFRLAARIKELRSQGHDIQTKPLILHDGKVVAQYSLAPKRPQNCGTGFCSCIECFMEVPK